MAPCTVRWCGKTSANSSLKKDGITFHQYPHDNDLKKQWIKATRRENWFPSKYSVICSRHFTEDCFFKMKSHRRLLSTAVPTVCLPILSEGIRSPDPVPSTSSKETKYVTEDSTSDQEVTRELSNSPTHKKKKKFPGNPSDYIAPINKRLCRRIIELSDMITHKNKLLKNLRYKTKYLRMKVEALQTQLDEFIPKSKVRRKTV